MVMTIEPEQIDNNGSVVHAASGAILGAGLILSGMADTRRTAAFFDLTRISTGEWDPTLAVVFMSALGVNAVLHQTLIRHLHAPLRAKEFFLPTNTSIDTALITGSALFGAGWAVSGGCPGPLLVNSALGQPSALICAAGVAIGIGIHRAWRNSAVIIRAIGAAAVAGALAVLRSQETADRPLPMSLGFLGYPAIIGGTLIGGSAALLAAVEGRVMGVSGMVTGVLEGKEIHRRGSFLLGLATSASILGQALPRFVVAPANPPWINFISGVVIGFGTSIGNGCTSGHGVCGLARFSKRSAVATIMFIISNAIVSTFVTDRT